MNIPEGAVEFAAKNIAAVEDTTGWEQWIDIADVAIEASFRAVVAQALEDLVSELEDLPSSEGAEIKVGTWEYFELFPLQYIRDRAEAIRSTAGPKDAA